MFLNITVVFLASFYVTTTIQNHEHIDFNELTHNFGKISILHIFHEKRLPLVQRQRFNVLKR